MSDGLPTLKGRGIILRQLVDSDVDALFAVFSDPRVMRYWSWLPMTEREQAVALCRRIEDGWRRDAFYQWGIALDGSDLVVGTTTLLSIDRDHRRAEIGYAVASAYWRRGIGGAAVDCATRHAFLDLDLERLEADVDPRNDASLALLERRGFRREGLLRARYRVGDEVQDSVLLGLLREEWSPD